MAEPNLAVTGFCMQTRIFQSICPSVPLPPPDHPLSASSYVLDLLRSSPGHATSTAIIDCSTNHRISYQDFLGQVYSLAASLRQFDPPLCKGQVAYVLAPNSVQVPVLYLALLSLGLVVSPASPLGTPSDVSRQIRLTKPTVVFATPATAHKLPPGIPLVVLLHTHEFGRMFCSANPSSVHVIPSGDAIKQSDPAAILYSSGTTGLVKGALITQRNIIATVAEYHASRAGRASPAVILLPVPLFHVLGFMKWLGGVALGETVVIMERFELGRALRAVDEFRVTHMPAAPPVVAAMAREDSGTDYDLRSLEEVACGGAPLSRDAMERFQDKFPHVDLQLGYGMTEAGHVAQARCGRARSKGSVGLLAANLEAKIVEPVSGEALPPGQRGELWLRGPTVMQGYIGHEAATCAVLDSDGWLRTGDLCYFDWNGCIHIVDRLKELIKYKGYQVPPAEVEQLLNSHPEIVDAAVIPYPDEEAGEIPMAFVVRHPMSSLDKVQVMEFVAKHVASYKRIRRVAFLDSIPKNPSGKILRKDLRLLAVSSSSPSKL